MIFAIILIFIIASFSLLISLIILNNYKKIQYKFHGYLKAKRVLQKKHLNKGIVAFGSDRLQSFDKDIKEIEEISEMCAKRILKKNKDISFITGGGNGVMEAWLKPAYINGVQTAGFFVKFQHEIKMNNFCKISYVFTSLPIRKQCFFDYAICYVVFKGGFGTCDELFNLLFLMQNNKIERKPIFVYPSEFYEDVLNFNNFIKKGTISKEDSKLIVLCKTKEELLKRLYSVIDND